MTQKAPTSRPAKAKAPTPPPQTLTRLMPTLLRHLDDLILVRNRSVSGHDAPPALIDLGLVDELGLTSKGRKVLDQLVALTDLLDAWPTAAPPAATTANKPAKPDKKK